MPVREAPRLRLSSVRLAPGIAAPVASVTVPLTVAVVSWPKACDIMQNAANAHQETCLSDLITPPLQGHENALKPPCKLLLRILKVKGLCAGG